MKVYRKGKPVDMTEYKEGTIKTTKKCRNQVNKMLKEFLDSNKDYAQIKFDGGLLSENVFKAYYNIKICSNVWARYVVAVMNRWPDSIGKYVGTFSSNNIRENDVMQNEILSENYSSQYEYIPMGYKKVAK